MTNKEALKGTLDGLQFSDFALDKALLDQSIDGAATYSVPNIKAIDLAAVELLYTAYTQADVQEGGFSYSHPDFLRKVEARLLYLAKKHGLTDIISQVTPTIKNATNRW